MLFDEKAHESMFRPADRSVVVHASRIVAVMRLVAVPPSAI